MSWKLMRGGFLGDGPEYNAVSAYRSNDVWAVGRLYKSQFGEQWWTRADHWDGTRWVRVSTPYGGGAVFDAEFTDVSVARANDVWAVGYRETSDEDVPLIAHYACAG
jgi:hypothetical protein